MALHRMPICQLASVALYVAAGQAAAQALATGAQLQQVATYPDSVLPRLLSP